MSMKEIKRKTPVSLYVHIPFCVRKCAYCDFLSAPASEETKERYVNLICEEIERQAVCYSNYYGETVFFGGGTPTTLSVEQLEKILCKLKGGFSIDLWKSKLTEAGADGEGKAEADKPEITIECNPGTVDGESLRKLREAGFNRLSIGLQSARNEELKSLGRIHTWEDFLKTYDFARKAGFQNINVDIMSALPGQSVESYGNTIRQVITLAPEHISAYSLIIEEGTPFYEWYGEADRQRRKDGEDKEHLLPSEEEERQMYMLTEELLRQNGYYRYEISNYARPGYECRHNIAYWRRKNYLGFGLGAASLMENCRFAQTWDLEEYEMMFGEEGADKVLLNGGYGQEKHMLSKKEQMEEFMFLGLRLTNGVSAAEFFGNFQLSIEEIYGDVLKKLEKQGFLRQEKDRIWLTSKGVDLSNVVLAEFLLRK